jgi:hypothetical protein
MAPPGSRLDDEDQDMLTDLERVLLLGARLEYSRAGTTPSDLDPMSTRISSRSSRMMIPSITSPYLRDL